MAEFLFLSPSNPQQESAMSTIRDQAFAKTNIYQ
jgi:hypothetical protein